MKTLILEVKSQMSIDITLNHIPDLESRIEYIQKGLTVLKQHAPRIFKYISKEHTFANIKEYKILLKCKKDKIKNKKQLLLKWLKRKKNKRLLYIIIESFIFPLTWIFTPIPGPNVAFFAILVMLYFHLNTFIKLKKTKIEDLKVEVDESLC